jgi:hypothetical protein
MKLMLSRVVRIPPGIGLAFTIGVSIAACAGGTDSSENVHVETSAIQGGLPVSERPRRREQRPDRAGYVMAEARDAIA